MSTMKERHMLLTDYSKEICDIVKIGSNKVVF